MVAEQESEQVEKDAAVVATELASASGAVLDLDAWRGDLGRLHGTIDQVVQSFISSQTRQLDAVAAELASQKERIALKERRFVELSDSIAEFVEAEAKRLEASGVPLDGVVEADARAEAYDSELPGPPALHRINRLWRKAMKAFEAMRAARDREAADALEQQQAERESCLAEAESRYQALQQERDTEVAALKAELEATRGEGMQQQSAADKLTTEMQDLAEQLEGARAACEELASQLEDAEASKKRAEYEWGVEREELERQRSEAQAIVSEVEGKLTDSVAREEDLKQKCADRAQKLEDMKRIMDDQEGEMNQKIERVQQYVKERQVGALQAEQKQKDAERMAERWQGEVRRLQAEKDKLSKLLLDNESRESGRSNQLQGVLESQREEIRILQEKLQKREDEMRSASMELLQQRDEEYQARVNHEKQQEKTRSIALLKKKEQELHIKDQQLRAARQRVQELERAAGIQSTGPSSKMFMDSPSSGLLPPLPLSAR